MMEAKFTGSYYTPEILADFLVSHVLETHLKRDSLKVLEPSCGDGQFIKSLFKHLDIAQFENIEVDLVEINNTELSKATLQVPADPKVKLTARLDDYLSVFLADRKRYNFIIGNPPYIRKRHLSEEHIDLCERCHDKARQSSEHINSRSKVNNIWTVFVELSVLSLTEDGILCFVLPADILQVNYAKEIRELICHEFERVEIFAFNELVFQGIQQDVVAVVAIKKICDPAQRGFSFFQVERLTDLKEPWFTEKYNNVHRSALNKWTNYLLSEADLDLIERLTAVHKRIDHYCSRIAAGIVTAANDYFIVNKSTKQKSRLDTYTGVSNILLKGSVVKPLAQFECRDLDNLEAKDERMFFVQGPNEERGQIDRNLLAYIEEAERDSDVANRFKMKERDFWYHVPNTWRSDILFAKRCDFYPRLFFNSAGVLATDSFYRIVSKSHINAKCLIFGFYNSLTLLLTEMEGRYYGGGVLELTPNEFKKLVIPYREDVTDLQFQQLDSLFRSGESLQNILDFTDNILLPEVQTAELHRLRELRNKLVNRRRKMSVAIGMIPSEEYSLC